MDNLPKSDPVVPAPPQKSSIISSNVVKSPFEQKGKVRNQFILILIISTIGIGAAFGTFYVINQFQQSQSALKDADDSFAWSTGQVAQAICTDEEVVINVSFRNKETDPSKSMNVIATDEQSGQSVDLGEVAPDTNVDAVINTNRTSLISGKVRFDLTWTNGNNTDTRFANYSSVSCNQVSPTPSVDPSPSVSTRPSPTFVPSPTENATPTPTASPTQTSQPTPTVEPTPTQTPSSTIPPSSSSDGRSDGLGCATKDCSGNKVGGDPNAVASAGTASTLPDAGIPNGFYAILSGVLLLGSGLLINKQKRF